MFARAYKHGDAVAVKVAKHKKQKILRQRESSAKLQLAPAPVSMSKAQAQKESATYPLVVCRAGRYNTERIMRYAAKVDIAQPEIVAALRAAGCSVLFIGKPLDLLVGRAGITYLLECKSGEAKRDDLTKPQKDFFRDWRGHAQVVCSPEEALQAVGIHVI